MSRRVMAGLILAAVAGAPAVAQGALLWQRSVGGSAGEFDQAASVVVDSRGDVVAAGSTRNTGSGDDFTVAKWDRAGTLLWKRAVGGSAGGNDVATAVVADAQGNVIAVGRTENTGTGDDFTVVKWDRNGTLLWRRSLSGSAGGADVALAVALDGAGSVIAAGTTVNTGTGADFTVAKWDRNGTLLWKFTRAGAGDGEDAALSVAVDAQGNPVAAGYLGRAGAGTDFALVKIDRATGGFLWIVTLAGAAGLNDEARAVAVDKQGNVVAAGLTRNSGALPDFTVARFGPNGAFYWQQTLNGSAYESDAANAVALDANGDVIAAGLLSNDGAAEDFAVMKLAGESGAPLWVTALNGIQNGSDAALSVTVDAQGNAIAGGVLTESDLDGDFAVLKYDGSSGAPLWRQTLAGDAGARCLARAVAVDGTGSILAAGVSSDAGGQAEFTVVKLDP